MGDILVVIVTGLLSGGIIGAVASLVTSRATSRKLRAEASSLGAKTPVEVESISIATMRTALEAAEDRIRALVQERRTDRDYYESRISEMEQRIMGLQTELDDVRDRLNAALRSTAEAAADLGKLRRGPHREG